MQSAANPIKIDYKIRKSCRCLYSSELKAIKGSHLRLCDIDYNDISISSSVSDVSVPHSNIQKEQSSKRVCKATKLNKHQRYQL